MSTETPPPGLAEMVDIADMFGDVADMDPDEVDAILDGFGVPRNEPSPADAQRLLRASLAQALRLQQEATEGDPDAALSWADLAGQWQPEGGSDG